ncbi:hypothetical protein ACLOAV_009640 [Pseudogymnoascus australis]
MARNKVHPLSRKRIAQACSSCKRRKEKCDGAKPCKNCKSQKRDHLCQYPTSQKSMSPHITRPLLQDESSPLEPNSEDILALLDNGIDEYSQSGASSSGSIACTTSAPVPKVSRMLVGSNGGFTYIGDSASLSFLQTIRRAVSDIIGPCDLTTDSLRHQMLEATPATRFVDRVDPKPNLMTALLLVDQYMVAVSGTLDLFNRSWLADQLPAWIGDSTRTRLPNSPVIYLALAIGALSKSQNYEDEELAEQYFGYGRELATANLMDEPSLLTVQAFLLISYYMVASCRRNAAFINLGVAVRAAYTLGIHRHEANAAFVKREGLDRERAWKSLRVCDLFLSASMGRPPATLEETCNISWAPLESTDDRENSTVKAQLSSAIFRICHIFERVLKEVYSKRVISIELAASISQQHRDWTKELPTMLKVDGLSDPAQPNTAAICQTLGSSMVIMAYYYSIILLTRPFLTLLVCTRSKVTGPINVTTEPETSIGTYADACVDSAIKGVNIAEKVASDESMPKRHPLIVNSVFISTLCLGMASFSDYDRRGWPLIPTMDSAIVILENLGQFNPLSARYAQICRFLRQAAYQHMRRRDVHISESSSKAVQKIFGDVQAGVVDAAQPTGTPTSRSPVPRGSQSLQLESLNPNSYDFNYTLQESMNTTTGLFATPMENDVESHFQDTFQIGRIASLCGGDTTSDANSIAIGEHVHLFSSRNNLAMVASDVSHGHIDLPNWTVNMTGD